MIRLMPDIAHTSAIASALSAISVFALLAAVIVRRPLIARAGRTLEAHFARMRRTRSRPSWLSRFLPSELEKQALLAGWSHSIAISALAHGPVVITALLLLILGAMALLQCSLESLAFSALAGIIAAASPYLFLKNALARRRKAIARALPDTLDLLAMVLRAGLGADAALRKTADCIAGLYPELARELRITLAELQFLPDQARAYQNLKQRTGAAGLEALVAGLSQANRHGVPIAESIATAAAAMRATRLAEAERRAASLPAKLAAPLVIFFLPAIFVVVLVPALLGFLGGR